MSVNSSDKKKLGKWIKQARESHNPYLSQRQLALAVEITNASLSSIESGCIFPSERVFLNILDKLQPPSKRRNEMLELFARAKETPPPDINEKLSKSPDLWNLVRELLKLNPTEAQSREILQMFRQFENQQEASR